MTYRLKQSQSTTTGVGKGKMVASQVSMKPAHGLGLTFRSYYRIFQFTSSLSLGEERQKSERENVTHDCKRDVRKRAASSTGVGRQSLLARSNNGYPSHVTLTVMLAFLFVLHSSPQFLRKSR